MAKSTDIVPYIPEKSLLRPDEVAELFSVHVRTIYRWEAEGKLGGIKFTASCLRFPRNSIIKFINSLNPAT